MLKASQWSSQPLWGWLLAVKHLSRRFQAVITDRSISPLSRTPDLQVETFGKKNPEDQLANSQGRSEWRRETRYFSSKTFNKIKPKGIMCFSFNRRAVTHRKVGKHKEDYKSGFTRLKKRHRPLRGTVRSGRSKCRQFPALETEFGFQNNAYIHFEWK